MTKVYSKALDKTIEIGRLIRVLRSGTEGPSLIFTGGIHGNEPSSIFALNRVFEQLESQQINFNGNIYALAGNLWALERGERYQEEDLNRLWVKDTFESLQNGTFDLKNQDRIELKEIYELIMEILERDKGPFYFFDLHTTSSETIPFLTVNDSLLNRKFTSQYPSPIILGIEEYLDGPLLSSINELGYVAFGFEGGQHDDLSAIENHEAFIFLSLAFADVVSRNDIDFEHYYQVLAKNALVDRKFYEIFYRKELKPEDEFTMKPGFLNFQQIRRGEELAIQNKERIKSMWNARIFMPLYQAQGNDGFFVIRPIPKIFLRLSASLRKFGFVQMFAWLPGVKWAKGRKDILIVNTSIARIFSKQIFHLLGFRSKQVEDDKLIMKNREYVSRSVEYRDSSWFK